MVLVVTELEEVVVEMVEVRFVVFSQKPSIKISLPFTQAQPLHKLVLLPRTCKIDNSCILIGCMILFC